ncbi:MULTISPECIES: hypothetical protein [unclassified Streptomyces]
MLLVPVAATLARLMRRGQGQDGGAAATTALAGGLGFVVSFALLAAGT